MSDITLEKIDEIRKRLDVTYEKAREALIHSDGDVIEAIVYLEKGEETNETCFESSSIIDELKAIIMDILEKGNVTRIKIKKDDKQILDIPVNAGLAGAAIGIIIPKLFALGVIAAIVTKVTIEVTKDDGSVEVINKYVSKVANEVKEKTDNIVEKVKTRVNEVKSNNTHIYDEDSTVCTYTVNFEEENSEENSEENQAEESEKKE